MTISDAVVQAVRENADIVTVAESYTQPLRKAGAQLVGLCPLHAEKTASFYVHPGKNVWRCHGCLGGGDAIALVQAKEQCTFTEAVRLLAQQFGIAVDGPVDPAIAKRAEENRKRREQEQAFREWSGGYERECFQQLYALRRAARYAEAAIRGGAGQDIEEAAWDCLKRLIDFEIWLDREQPLDTANLRQKWEERGRAA